jgi:multidrug efflux pump subunit AcrA (membrane-fusion protein)
MSDESSTVGGRDISNALLISLGLSLVLAIVALIWCYALSNHVTLAEQKLAAEEQKNTKLEEQQLALTNRLRATTETLGQSVGLTQKQIEVRTQALMASQAAAMNLAKQQSERTAQLAEEEKAAEQKLGAVQSDVSTVKTDVGGAKASIAATQSDLDQTKQQLQRTIGDEHQMSGLIATNHDQLELLKHKGDRNYYEFTLQKGAKPTLLSTIKVQAKKVDEKHSRYTLMVSSDDRNIEKKDRTLDEPLQFYSGKDPVLYEIVVNNISKNTISGYLSTPKGVPQPAAAPSN